MLDLEKLKADRQLVNQIDWHMSPEKAIDGPPIYDVLEEAA